MSTYPLSCSLAARKDQFLHSKIIALTVVFILSLTMNKYAIAAGPDGYGSIKIGSKKQSIDALIESDGIYLRNAMIPYNYKYSNPKEGIEKFDADIISPLSKNPLKSVLSFDKDGLINIYISFDESEDLFNKAKDQIKEKYGDGEFQDKREEEQCIYKNGANFKISSGDIYFKWIDSKGEVETTLSKSSIEVCPSNLGFGKSSPIKLNSLTIKKIEKNKEKIKNMF